MSKALILIYGAAAANAAMKAMAITARLSDKSVDINLRSAEHFSAVEVEPAKQVVIIGEYPKIAEAYEGKAEVQVVSLEDALANTDQAPEAEKVENTGPAGDTTVKVSDAAAKHAADNKIDLAAVTGTGKDGTITKGDVEAAVKAKAAG